MIKVVQKPDYREAQYPDAAGWHIDDVSQLHVRGPEREGKPRLVIASYARGEWASVRVEGDDAEGAEA